MSAGSNKCLACGGMRDALAHAGFSFHVSRRPSDPGLRVNMRQVTRHDPGFAVAGFSRVLSARASTTIVFISGAGSPCCPRLKIDFHQDFERSLPGADLLTEACGVAPTGKGCGQKVADTGDSY